MALSRKRRKELKRLKNQAGDLWDDQREVLDHAAKVVREARKQAKNFAREEVSPRIRHGYEERVQPVFSGARHVVGAAKDKFVDDVLPAMSSALGTALAAIEVAKNQQVRNTIARVAKLGGEAAERTGLVKPKKAGPGRYILIGIGVVTAAAVAYAAWQTLRADDDLWIDDEDVDVPPTSAGVGV
jgi:ElaB/YqjD/DUF883 family membrane-anchored ribosome-binding protein